MCDAQILYYAVNYRVCENPQDTLSRRSFSRKRATNFRALLQRMTYKDNAFITLRHPVLGGLATMLPDRLAALLVC